MVTRKLFAISFVYGMLKMVGRKLLWNNLKCLALDMGLPWLVLWDFNSFLSLDGKHGGLSITPYHVQDFQNYVALASMKDLTYMGYQYTWTNGLICNKLDHAFINKLWLEAELRSYAKFATLGCLSDHLTYLVSILEEGTQIPKSFKFFNMWAKHKMFS